MTTHEQQTSTAATSAEDVEPVSRPELSSAGSEPSTAQAQSPATGTEPSAPETEQRTDEPLFADGTLLGLRSRWDDIQAAFVDDPKECVQKADALVAQVVERLTTGFSETRSRLEEQWAKGEEASTEDLRIALKRYREFFQRLLSV
jgi:hypothetical protein